MIKLNKQVKSIIAKIHSLSSLKGKIVAIETKTGKWFSGESPLEVIEKGRKEYPIGFFYIIKSGFKAAGMLKKMR